MYMQIKYMYNVMFNNYDIVELLKTITNADV